MSYRDPRAVSDNEARAAVAELPERIRRVLALGPLPGEPCRLCATLGRAWFANEANYDEADPRWIIFDFHDEPGRWRTGGFTAEEGRERYRRCLVVYRAAGYAN